jgi:peptidoglycan/LPS O-acetylase OafA/YrhL
VLSNLVYINDFAYLSGGYSSIWFCTLYITAAYIRKHVPANPRHRFPALTGYFLCASMIAIERFAATAITPMIFGSVKLDSLFCSNNSIMTAGASIFLLLFFRSVEIKNPLAEKAIRFFAPLSFGVYLIHDHTIIRQLLWNWLNPAAMNDSCYIVPYFIACITGVFVVCCLIEWIRCTLFRLCGIDRLVNSLCNKLQSRVERWLGES